MIDCSLEGISVQNTLSTTLGERYGTESLAGLNVSCNFKKLQSFQNVVKGCSNEPCMCGCVFCSFYCLQIISVNHGPLMCRNITILIKNIC